MKLILTTPSLVGEGIRVERELNASLTGDPLTVCIEMAKTFGRIWPNHFAGTGAAAERIALFLLGRMIGSGQPCETYINGLVTRAELVRERDLKNECPNCHWGFASPEVLAQHIREKH